MLRIELVCLDLDLFWSIYKKKKKPLQIPELILHVSCFQGLLAVVEAIPQQKVENIGNYNFVLIRSDVEKCG